jgi:branched-chain amino acid transport system ATP-binding protein
MNREPERVASVPDGSSLPTAKRQALVVKDLYAYYGSAQALSGVTLAAVEGEVLGIVGENGAGKSTLLRTISGLHRKASGVIEYRGVSLIGRRPDTVAMQGISFVRDGAHVFENLTIRDHLVLACRVGQRRNSSRHSVDDVLDLFPILRERGPHVRAGYLSGGQRQMVCLAMAVGSGSDCLLLDEPSAGLAERVAEEIFQFIRGFANSGVTIILVEQATKWLNGLADRILELEMGQIVGEVRP